MAAKKPKKKVVKKAAKKPKASRREVRDNPGMGHNIATLRDEGVPYIERFLALKASHESDNAGYAADFGKLYEEAAGVLGIKATVLKFELNRLHKNKKAAEKEAEMKADEREQTELFRSAMEGTQFEMFTAGDLADAAAVPEAADEDSAEAADEEGAE
jgi:hypothetical protein